MSKCSYCSFVSKCATEQEINEYFKYLNIQLLAENEKFKDRIVSTIYIGGGTPSYVNDIYITDVLKTIKEYYNVSKNAEISIECNPCSITKQKLIAFKNAGINRISFGVQSLNDNCLAIIGRKHNSQMAINAIKLAKSVGFNNISCDLLIGIPKQTNAMLLQDIKQLSNLGVTHISAYMLMLEEGTKLYEQVVIKHMQNVASDDECVNMYNQAYTLLNSLGYKRYEISNFATQGYECKHNINYWKLGEYVGFGVAAHSFYNGTRISGFNHFENYYQFIKEKYILRIVPKIKPEQEKLTDSQKIEECLMLGLRQTKGVNLKKLLNFGYDLLNDKKDIIKNLKKCNFIDYNKEYLFITPQSFGATNQIILNLLPD